MEKALPSIPAKRYFTIGEVSDLCGVKPYVLRYWEQEFTQLKPMKRRGNRRYYQHHEVLLIRRIRDLLYEQGFTISGARNRLSELAHSSRLEAATRGSAPGEDALDGSGLDEASDDASERTPNGPLADAAASRGAAVRIDGGFVPSTPTPSVGRSYAAGATSSATGDRAGAALDVPAIVSAMPPLRVEGPALSREELRRELSLIRELLIA